MMPSFNWTRAQVFLATAESGSFSAAARILRSTQPTVGRQVSALEDELGVALFERIGNNLELTPAGLEFAEHVRAMDDAATRAALIATGHSQRVEGPVRVTASELISAYLLPNVVRRIRLEHPRIDLEIVASNAMRDLQRREADIAVRNVAPTEPELTSRKVAERVARFYATPGYLASVGLEGDVSREALSRTELFGFVDLDRMLGYLTHMGMALTRENFPIITDNHLVQWQYCLAGLGVGIVMDQVGDAEPRVRRLSDGLPTLPVPIYLVAHRDIRTSRRMRAVFDILADELGRGWTP